jgi:predicted O-methyltransferase YrrM
MDHFYQDIHGWFGFANTYQNAVNTAIDGAHFVEVGSWKGRSAAFMAVTIANSGKKIKFDCIDTWEGSPEHQVGAFFQDQDVLDGRLYQKFLTNMKPVSEHYTAIRLPSLDAVELYEDNSLDLVFIDARHDYDSVKADISAWLPKVKLGGILAGDDYLYEYFPGVCRAVNEMLTAVQIEDNSTWVYKKI